MGRTNDPRVRRKEQELTNKETQLDNNKKEQQRLEAGIHAVDGTLSDIRDITTKLRAFASVWTAIVADLTEVQKKLSLANSSGSFYMFCRRLDTVSGMYRTLGVALYRYATLVENKDLFKDKSTDKADNTSVSAPAPPKTQIKQEPVLQEIERVAGYLSSIEISFSEISEELNKIPKRGSKNFKRRIYTTQNDWSSHRQTYSEVVLSYRGTLTKAKMAADALLKDNGTSSTGQKRLLIETYQQGLASQDASIRVFVDGLREIQNRVKGFSDSFRSWGSGGQLDQTTFTTITAKSEELTSKIQEFSTDVAPVLRSVVEVEKKELDAAAPHVLRGAASRVPTRLGGTMDRVAALLDEGMKSGA